MTAVAFGVAAAAGGVARHLVNRLGYGWRGTLAINVVGSFLLGVLLAAGPPADIRLVLGTGALGAFTTFSALALEASEGPRHQRALLVAGSLVAGVAAAALGWALG